MTPFVVALAGPSGSGKSSLARALGEALGPEDCAVLSLDAYYHDLSGQPSSERANFNFDHPGAIDFPLVMTDLTTLRSGCDIQPPCYDFVSRVRLLNGPVLPPRAFILVEGIFALAWPEAAECFDFGIYIDVDADTSLARRVVRDRRERGRDEQEVRTRFESHVRPSLAAHVEPQRQRADLVVAGTAPLEQLVGTCLAEIETRAARRATPPR